MDSPSPVRRRRCGKGMEAPTTEDMPVPALPASARDWSELPLDALASVFVKLGAIVILMGAGLVCRSWLQAAKVPHLWRSVNMARHKAVDGEDGFGSWVVEPEINGAVLCSMAKAAVDRSGGQLQVFLGKRFVSDQVLEYIGERSPTVKAIGLISCEGISNKGFNKLISNCPQIEHLILMICLNVGGHDVFEATGKACPHLKRFRLKRTGWSFAMTTGEALGVAAMHGLQNLVLIGSNVTNEELACIIVGCPHLESLDLRGCFNIVADDALRGRCAGIKSLLLPRYCKVEEDEYEMAQLAAVCSRDVDFCSETPIEM